jgi:hypothetical protein
MAKWLVQDHQVDVHICGGLAFTWACENGHIEIAKWHVQDHQVDVHAEEEDAFRSACENGHVEVAIWLAHDHQVDVHVGDEFAFQLVCDNGHIKIINWFIEEFRYSRSPYYYHNQTAYILNHQPLNDWESCTILDCPVIYDGELDEPAVIAFMATLKKPKSARS